MQVVRTAVFTTWFPCCDEVQLWSLVPHSDVFAGLGRIAAGGSRLSAGVVRAGELSVWFASKLLMPLHHSEAHIAHG